jgi:WD40 repeat protein
MRTGKALSEWPASCRPVNFLQPAPDGKTVVTASRFEGALHLWELPGGKEVLPLAGHGGPATPLHFSADGRQLVTKAGDNTIRQWDLATGREHLLFRRPLPDPYSGPYVSPDGKTFLTCAWSDKLVRQWDAQTGKETRALGKSSYHPSGGSLIHAFSPAGEVVAVRGADSTIVLWSLRTGREVCRLPEHADELVCLRFSPDGKTLASAAVGRAGQGVQEEAIRLWDVATGKELRRFGPAEGVSSLLFSPDGKLLASGGGLWTPGAAVRIWHAASGRALRQIADGRAPLAWSADGRLLAVSWEKDAAAYEAKVIICEAATGQEVRRFASEQTPLQGAAFAPDGRTLATGCWDSSVLIWDLTSRLRQGRLQEGPLPAADREACWAALAGAADKAQAAIWRLAAAPESAVALLKDRLRPVAEPDLKRLPQLVADLGSESFAVRARATRELGRLDATAAPVLRKFLAGNQALEVRRRLEAVLEKLESKGLSPEQLRQVRAVTVLEQIGTPEAVRLLERLATGPAAAPLTQAARSSRERLARSTPAAP